MQKEVLFNLGYGLYVLTANWAGKDNGCIVNTVMQVADKPTTLMISVNKNNYTNEMIFETLKFNISIISEKADFELFKHFGFQSGRTVNKFANYENAKRAANGILYVTEGTNSYISAKVTKTVDMGSHTVYFAEITDGEVLNDDKSVTYAYYHSNIKPQAPKKEEKEDDGTKKYVCTICGYVHEGELPEDFICPLCKHGVDAFKEV